MDYHFKFNGDILGGEVGKEDRTWFYFQNIDTERFILTFLNMLYCFKTWRESIFGYGRAYKNVHILMISI